jgi:hypothetical protein
MPFFFFAEVPRISACVQNQLDETDQRVTSGAFEGNAQRT